MSPLPIRAAADMFRLLAKRQHAAMTLFVSCFEIYGNKVFDLLNARKKLNILEDGKKMVQVSSRGTIERRLHAYMRGRQARCMGMDVQAGLPGVLGRCGRPSADVMAGRPSTSVTVGPHPCPLWPLCPPSARYLQVVGLKEAAVHEVEQVKAMIRESEMNRSVGSTAANADSSRSHSIMQVRASSPQGRPLPPPPPAPSSTS